MGWTPLMFWPLFLMLRGSAWLSFAAFRNWPINYDNWTTEADGSIPLVLGWMAWQGVFLAFLLYWLEGIAPPYGTPKHPLFFLDSLPEPVRNLCGRQKKTPVSDVTEKEVERYEDTEPWDVREERQRVSGAGAGAEASNGPKMMIEIRNMRKVFEVAVSANTQAMADGGGSPTGADGCCCTALSGSYADLPCSNNTDTKTTKLVAVKNMNLGINSGECFGLLGHNGAGKTTTINMLVGVYPPTSGTAIVDGLSLEKDMPSIYLRMGVCPQHDILWDNLTAYETLLFYGRLKCLKGQELKNAVVKALSAVNLAQKAHVRVGSFSGGMKRRLSVACSLIGNPKVIYLDEPSTGLDPASRRQLWDVISNAKSSGSSSIVLTTHHLEEAEVLCDRIGIMSAGEMRCIGTAPSLRRRFGRGYTLTVTLSSASTEAADELMRFVTGLLPSARLLGTPMGGTSKFEVMKEDVVLSAVFKQFEACRTGNGSNGMEITDWGIYQTSLEEVFLKVTELAERGITCSKERSLSFLARHLDANSDNTEDVSGVGVLKVVNRNTHYIA